MGDAVWARRHAREAIDDGTWDAIDPQVRNHYFTALNLVLGGDRKRAERIVADWEATVPEEKRSVDVRTSMARIRIYLDVATGRGEGALERHREAAATHGCTICSMGEKAWIAERTGQLQEAIRLHEETRRGGFAFQNLNGPHRLRSTFALGPLYEEAGDTAAGVEAYRRVVELWGGTADARRMEKAEEARKRIAALGG